MCLPVLNLLNFELPSANKCKYVLTSPRSLKACRRAGVKPVDLLYRSLSEVEHEARSRDEAQLLFEACEAERQRKLVICRALRNELLLNGHWSLTGANYKADKHRRYSPRLRDPKERGLPAITGSYLLRRAETPENMRPKDQPSIPRLCMYLPKVNMSLEDNPEVVKKEYEKEIETCAADGGVPNEEKEERGTINDKNYDEKLLEELNQSKLKGDKVSPTIDDLDLVPNILQKNLEIQQNIENSLSNMGNAKENSPTQQENYSTQDINNNHVKGKSRRPNSVSRKKCKDSKKHMKELDFKKALQRMKVEYSDPEYCTLKYKQVIENSVERDLRELEVQRVHRELEAGMERWQDRVLLLQWLDLARAREQACRELEMKVERLQQKNRAKNIIHTININKVKEAEDMKAEGLRRQVQEKNRKIFQLHQEKERIIYESKTRALSLQELKDHIKSIMSPETFDKKVAKLSMRKKVLDTQMCARTMQRSHIWLG